VVLALGELLDHLPVERGDVLGAAAADDAVIRYDLLIYPVATGVPDVRLE
jgi:hypothetical protein